MNPDVDNDRMWPYPTHLVIWQFAYGALAAVCMLLLRMLLPSVLYMFTLNALVVCSAWTGVMLLRRHPESRAWSWFLPFAALPLWIIPGYIAYGTADMIVHGGEGTHKDTVLSIAICLLVTLALIVPAWLAVARVHWRMIARAVSSGQVRGDRERRASPAKRVLRFAVIAFVAILVLLSTRASENRSLIHEAARHGWTVVLQALIGIGQSPNVRTSRVVFPFRITPDHYALGLTPLHCAAENGRPDAIRYLLRNGADINARTERGSTAAILAAQGVVAIDHLSHRYDSTSDHRTTLKTIILAGADLGVQNTDGESVMSALAELNRYDRELVHLAVEHGAPLNSSDTDPDVVRGTILGAAIRAGDDSEISYLMAHGAMLQDDLEAVDGEETISRLLAHGVNINARTRMGKTLLHMAVDDQECATVALLLRHGADVNSRDGQGMTPLHHACNTRYSDSVEVVRVLIRAGADTGAHDKNGRTPLDLARANGNTVVVKLLSNPRVGGSGICPKATPAPRKKAPNHQLTTTNEQAILLACTHVFPYGQPPAVGISSQPTKF